MWAADADDPAGPGCPGRPAPRFSNTFSSTRQLPELLSGCADVMARHAGTDAGHDLVRNRSRPPGPLGDRRLPLGAGPEQDDLVTRPRRVPAQVDDELVHRDPPGHRVPAPGDPDMGAPGRGPRQTVGVAQ